MQCHDVDKVKPLDELFDEKAREFGSGEDQECDRDLDSLIWKLGDYESEEPPQAAGEFGEEPPIEEELVEKRLFIAGRGRALFTESGQEDDVAFAMAGSLGPETRKRKGKAVRRGFPARKRK